MLNEIELPQVKLFSIEAEQNLIGGLIIDPSPIYDVLDIVSENDFYSADHKVIFSVMAQLIDQGQIIDLVVVAAKCAERTGRNFLVQLTEIASAAAGSCNAKAYAHMILERSVKRQVMAAANSVQERVNTHETDTAEEIVNFAQTALTDIDDKAEKGTAIVSASEVMHSYIKNLDVRMNQGDELQGISSGFEKMDALTNGWKKGHLVIIAGRPSMGKTTYALQLAKHASVVDGKNGLFFSLEMANDELMEKLIACTGSLNLEDLQKPKYIRDENFWPTMEATARRIKSTRFNIVECPSIHINQLKSYARKSHRREPLDYIMVDHIHLMGSNLQSRERQIAEITSGLKGLSGELKVPVFALAQLNRGVESRPDKRPMMSDLKDSGSIEQDADIIQMVYRDDYYNEDDNNPNKGLVQIDMVKHRNGKKGKVFLWNRFDQSRLEHTDSFMTYAAAPAARGYKKPDHGL